MFQGRSDAKLQKEISAKNQTYRPIFIYLAKFETESFFIFPSGNIFSLGDWFLKIFWKRSINVPSVLNKKGHSKKILRKVLTFFKCKDLSWVLLSKDRITFMYWLLWLRFIYLPLHVYKINIAAKQILKKNEFAKKLLKIQVKKKHWLNLKVGKNRETLIFLVLKVEQLAKWFHITLKQNTFESNVLIYFKTCLQRIQIKQFLKSLTSKKLHNAKSQHLKNYLNFAVALYVKIYLQFLSKR